MHSISGRPTRLRSCRRREPKVEASGIVAARAIEASLYEHTWNREDYDLAPGLRRVRMPALVIHGERDLCPPELAREIATAMPHGRLAVVEDCGHFAYLEQPEAVSTLVMDFLGPSDQATTR